MFYFLLEDGMDLVEKKVKAESSIGVKIDCGSFFTWVKEKCFAFKGGAETLVNAGLKTLVELGVVVRMNAQLNINLFDKVKTFSLSSMSFVKDKTEVTIKEINARLDEIQATLGDKVEVTNNQVVAKKSELAATQEQITVNSTQVERNGTAIASTSTEITTVETKVEKGGTQVTQLNSQLERAQTVVSQRGSEIKRCDNSLSKQGTKIQSSNLLMLG